MHDILNLDQYLERYGQLLGEQARQSLEPLHTPGQDHLPDFSQFMRQPFPAQQHLIAGTVAALNHQKGSVICGEMGTGKTLMAMVAAHLHAKGKPYRAICMVPNQLVNKWKREILETIPGAKVTMIEHCSVVARLYERHRFRREPGDNCPHWYIIARDRAKAAAKWKGAAVERKGSLHCPRCAARIEDKDGVGLKMADLDRRKRKCKECKECLFNYYGKQRDPKAFNRFEPSAYIHKKLRRFFDYLVLDEVHELKGGADVEQAMAAGSLMAGCRKIMALTGTLIGGYAWHIRSILLRMQPQSLIGEGLHWHNPGEFDKRYGVIETTVMEKEGETVESNRHGRGGKSRRESKAVKPGIVPTLFGRHLLGNSVYMGLAEVSDRLPELREFIVPVDMGADQGREYDRISKALRETNAELLRRNNKALLGAMLQTLLAYPDYPWDWKTVGYWDNLGVDDEGKKVRRFVPVVQPQTLPETPHPKEEKLLEIIREEKAQGRQCWVFVQYTETHDVQTRLLNLLRDAGFTAKELRASVDPAKREEWIAKNGPGVDVIVSFPKLVETGLDLFDKRGGHNFVSLIFYETGYNLFTMRQAARRSWRIGQKRQCRVYYLYYAGTIQEAAMTLMGKKMTAAQALEGKFSSEGLAAMGGDEGSLNMALAKTLDSCLKGDAARAWAMAADTAEGAYVGDEPLPVIEDADLDIGEDAVDVAHDLVEDDGDDFDRDDWYDSMMAEMDSLLGAA